MASIIELQNRIKLLGSFSKVVNIQKIVVMKTIAELKGRMKALANSYDLLYKTITEIKDVQPSLFDHKLFITDEKTSEENELKDGEFKLTQTLVTDKRAKFKKAIFLMSTKPIDKLSHYSIKRMAAKAKEAWNKDIIYITLGDELKAKMEEQKVPVFSSIGDEITFGKSNEIFKEISELTLSLYETLTATNISFVFDDIDNPKELKEVSLLPFSQKLGGESIDKSALAGTNDDELNKILETINVKETSFERGLEFTSEFMLKMQIQNVVELAHLSYVFSSSNRELQNLDDKEKNVEVEREITNLKMQRIRKETITNELISTSGAFMGINAEEDEDE